MSRTWTSRIGLVGLALVAGLTGCQNALYTDNQNYRRENTELRSRNQALSERVTSLESELGTRPDAGQVAELQAGLSERDRLIADLQSRLRTPAAGGAAAPGIEGIETEFNSATGEMTVRVPGDVLFDAGVATLKPGARATLDKIAAALNADYAGKAVRVEGHTDSDPLVRTRAQWGDNRNLSAARAIAVTRYLEGKGVDPKRLAAVGVGEHRPRGNDKAKNRRVEIVVVTR